MKFFGWGSKPKEVPSVEKVNDSEKDKESTIKEELTEDSDGTVDVTLGDIEGSIENNKCYICSKSVKEDDSQIVFGTINEFIDVYHHGMMEGHSLFYCNECAMELMELLFKKRFLCDSCESKLVDKHPTDQQIQLLCPECDKAHDKLRNSPDPASIEISRSDECVYCKTKIGVGDITFDRMILNQYDEFHNHGDDWSSDISSWDGKGGEEFFICHKCFEERIKQISEYYPILDWYSSPLKHYKK